MVYSAPAGSAGRFVAHSQLRTVSRAQSIVYSQAGEGTLTHSVDPKIAAVLRHVGELPAGFDITGAAHLKDDLGIDSLKLIDVVTTVEDELGVAFGDDFFEHLVTAGDLERYVAELAG
jgi:acyl carrier protein